MPLKDPVARKAYMLAWRIKNSANKPTKKKVARKRIPALQRFVKNIRFDESGCQIWTGGRRGLYGSFKYGPGLNTFAHRAAMYLAGIPIPNGLVVRHECDNPLCVNISHLSIGTRQDNSSDMVRKGRSVAGRGRLPHGVERAGNRRSVKYTARVRDEKRRVYLGVFDSIEEAASAVSSYREKRIQEMGG